MKKFNWLLFFLLIIFNQSFAFYGMSNYNNQVNHPYWNFLRFVNYYNIVRNQKIWLNSINFRIKNRVKPSNWLILTDFSFTFKENRILQSNFTMNNNISQYQKNFLESTNTTYNDLGYMLFPAAVSTLKFEIK
ncbi:MAG: hypothetical protein H0A74_03835 [Candidatus Vesicomyosocius endoextente]|uniref:Uncharacterized protein n=1 Tax=Candidatus Vesicomyosocius endoextente TaxID=2738853 RepID=A0A853GDU8_9GAMM|nr:hypothetical protein [Candidatus Vesicomyosocius endoextente]